MTDQLKNYFTERTTDAVLFFSNNILSAAEDPHQKQEALEEVSELLAGIEKDIMRDGYLDLIAKEHRWVKKNDLKKVVGSFQEQESQGTKVKEEAFKIDLPESDRNDVMRYGFYSKKDGAKTGYYFRTGEEGQFKSVSNFILTPLFHKYDQEDNTRIIKIDNGMMPPEIVEMPSKALISVDQFKSFLFDKGPFFFEGSKAHLDKLNKRYLFEFPKAYELKTLGWQTEGFFAFYNKSFNGKLANYNEAGLVKHGDHHFFSPASSEIYKDFRKDDDQFENDRYLEYVDPPIDFSEWCNLMTDTYEEHAWAGIGFVLKTLYRDIVFKVDNNDAFLYCYGQSKSGKSKFAESISNLFFRQMPAFNLNSGTDFAFAQRLARFRNCPVFFNEFDDSVVRDEWFQAIKGAFDGEGRERGKGMSRKKTETQKVNGSLMLVGQYLSTKDDNSVLSRSILRTFKLIRNRPEKQVKSYDRLKQLEQEGLTGILTELLPYRNYVKDNYYTEFNEVLKDLARSIRMAKREFDERVLRNYSSLVTMVKIFGKEIQLPFTFDQYRAWAIEEIVNLSEMLTQNDILVDFWNTVETMLENGILKHGVHIKVEELQSAVIHAKGKEETHIEFPEPKKILFVRMSIVQQEYAKFKRSTGSAAMDLTSLKTYTSQRDYFIGYNDKTEFKRFNPHGKPIRTITSAYLFDMDGMGINLEREEVDQSIPNPYGQQTKSYEQQREEMLQDVRDDEDGDEFP